MRSPMRMIPVLVLLLLTCSCILPVTGSHFRGAIIQWTPSDPVAFNGTVSKLSTLKPFLIYLSLGYVLYSIPDNTVLSCNLHCYRDPNYNKHY